MCLPLLCISIKVTTNLALNFTTIVHVYSAGTIYTGVLFYALTLYLGLRLITCNHKRDIYVLFLYVEEREKGKKLMSYYHKCRLALKMSLYHSLDVILE